MKKGTNQWYLAPPYAALLRSYEFRFDVVRGVAGCVLDGRRTSDQLKELLS